MIHAQRVERFFREVISEMSPQPVKAVVVTHIIPDRPHFIRALNSVFPIAAIIPKPKSIHLPTLESLGESFKILQVGRDFLGHPNRAESVLREIVGESPFVILDMGGYFAQAIDHIAQVPDLKLIGVVEDTENGHQRYHSLGEWPCPVASAARSPLKDPEDYLVGQSLVYSADTIMRQFNEIMIGKTALVIGYGKIGESVAESLHAKNVAVSVFDVDPVKRVRALSRGFQIPDRIQALEGADLIFCATGQQSLTHFDFVHLRNGCYVFSATSSDDEFLINDDKHDYTASRTSEYMITLSKNNRYFYLAAGGNAINFAHGAVVGSFIYLVQAELILGAHAVCSAPERRGIMAVDRDTRRVLARKWIDYFYDSSRAHIDIE